ncbi:vacuolar-sorting-associated protein 13 C-terminal domain containing protein [Nitzschia inconspicua]|uniref:Vacuolar-sorting-associated protein 13 C-terminal domain containing protein n=1 Tax=Nitzschia inconspicua TaxID=303405 RepID=A0A9K3LK95_9STRA|nr:vacuolar-sorting-associated protein 13 C-terminal domain containing protein [Nitzschia inconspicua]
MAKQVIIAALEEVIGEYVLNIDKENLKIAALQGKIKLENVQLDGDVLGGHILGSIGLSGFGILSCWAKSVVITIPIKNLEKEVTRIEMTGCHLLCLPLLPATAHQSFGAGNSLDPRCTLRTRAKRAKLVRFEKNYLQGRIPGEGPVARKILRAVREVERDQKKRRKRQQNSKSGNNSLFGSTENTSSTASSLAGDGPSGSILSDSDNGLDSTNIDTMFEDDSDESSSSARNGEQTFLYDSECEEEKSAKDPRLSDVSSEDLPQLPRDWKVKLREKVMRNMEASLHDIHVRCEVFEGGLDFCHPDHRKSLRQKKRNHRKDGYDQLAFAFGATLGSFVMRTANEKWESGSHEKQRETKEKDHLGPHPYDARHNKLHTWTNFNVYWDLDPAFLICETEIIRTPGQKISSEKFHSKIAAAMEALAFQQEPGLKIRESLVVDWKKYRSDKNSMKRGGGKEAEFYQDRPHQYICEQVQCRARQKMSDRTQPGPISCQAEFLPFLLNLKFRPHQFVQYQKLKSAMLSQQRFDTMLRQRPTDSPKANPREWWKYAYGCVTTRPNSRPWQDVAKIARNRDRYIALVEKRLSSGSGGSGFHRGLTDAESTELLKLEDLLPIEALLSFHLLALRRHFSRETGQKQGPKGSKDSVTSQNGYPNRGKGLSSSSLSRIFKSRSKSRPERSGGFTPLEPDVAPIPIVAPVPKPARLSTPSSSIREEAASSLTLLEAMTVRLGKKVWFVHFKVFHGAVTITLLSASDDEIVTLNSEITGTIKYFGRGKMDYFFDVSRFEAADCQTEINEKGKVLVLHPSTRGESSIPNEQDDASDDASSDISADLKLTPSFTGDELKQAVSFMELPPPGVVCRLAAVRDKGTTKLSFSSHPATLMWTRQCFDAVAEFFGAPSTKMQTELTSHLKHVATPLARKAQLAFLSQSTLLLHVNIAAPKIWVPFLSKGSNGAICFDAGNLKYSYRKEEGRSTVSWNLETNEIQVNFVRWHVSQVRDRMTNPFPTPLCESSRQHGVTSIVRPFQVKADGGMNEKQLATKISSGETLEYGGSVRYVDITIGTIALNLVDAEVLARAIGKWYSQGILSFRGRSSSKNGSRYTDHAAFSNTFEIQERAMRNFQSRNSTPHCLSLTVEKIEMALEGHSKLHFSDEKSIESHETSLFGQYTSPTRTYVVEVFQLKTSRTKNHDIIATNISLADASIVQLKTSSEYSPMNERHEARESQYCILERGLSTPGKGGNHEGSAILSIGMLHDGTVHLDEVEIDVAPVILRVTPTSLKDCTKGIRKIVEIGQVLTREMERKVHEEGRKARQRGRNQNSDKIIGTFDSEIRPISPVCSITSEATDSHTETERSDRTASSSRSPMDSSLIVKLIVKDGCLLAGRPTFSSPGTRSNRKIPRQKHVYSFAVVQVVSNALVMFQSVENADASGSKTLHVSIDNLCGSVDTEFEKLSLAQASPMIGPTGAEFRLVNNTENFGWAVSNDISLDCEHLKSCLTPNDLSILISIIDIMIQRLRGIQSQVAQIEKTEYRGGSKGNILSSLLRYQKSGTGIATNIRVELQRISFVVLRTFESKYGAPEFLSFNLKEFKTRLSGCMSALAGECVTGISVDFYNPEISEWEEIVERFPIKLLIDQMPNELIVDASTSSSIQLNMTGIFLRDFSELDVASFQTPRDTPFALTPSALSTVGLRRATETHVVEIHNHTGVDIEVDIEEPVAGGKRSAVRFDSYGPGLIKNNGYATFDSLFSDINLQQNLEEIANQTSKMCLRFPSSSSDVLGEREPLKGLSVISSSGASTTVHLLKPDSLLHFTTSHHERSCLTPSRKPQLGEEESVLTSSSVAPDYAYYHAEPVVEWCMQNQRLRSSTLDLYSLEKGRDLLSSSYWSPEEDYSVESIGLAPNQGLEATFEGVVDANEEDINRQLHSGPPNSEFRPVKSNWLRPYLKNDSPEWTDMTCILKMARERVMLPDNNWMWVNDWTVDVSGEYGEATDADGYEYSEDFETFSRSRRFYERGDCCRRRRWTRTRIVRPPRLDDPNRILKLVWETKRDARGNFVVDVKSHVTIHNSVSTDLSFFLYSPSWDEEKFVGTSKAGDRFYLPITLASAVYLRLAKKKTNKVSSSLNNFDASERVVMLPTSYNSDVLVRTSIKLNDVSQTTLHFLLNIKSRKGIVDIFIEPILKIVNLLPCQLECQLGEVLRPSERRQVDNRPVISGQRGKKFRIANVETMSVESGTEGKCVALNPGSKPHISLRVPGYRWSAWQRIVNRKANSATWRPSEAEEEIHINSNKRDSDFAEEFKTIVHFDRIGKSGDPLVLIISVEAGHSPTVRVFSQYWILDKTGFGCRFCESFSDIMGTVPDNECSRRTHLLKEDSRDPSMKKDMKTSGHQWSVGCNGMSMYFSPREKIAMSIESLSDATEGSEVARKVKSKWTVPMDVSNVMPKTVFSVDELGGPRRFELAISVTVCPGMFGRTKLITFIPRYQIVNLLKRELVIAQDGCLNSERLIPSRSTVPFHWERRSLAPKVRLGAPTMEEKDAGDFGDCWTNGCIQLDKVGITSMRLPSVGVLPAKPMVVQAEVRLAAKEQSSAVVIVIWSATEKSNPLYLLRNLTPYTIICRQPLQEEHPDDNESDNDGIKRKGDERNVIGRKGNGLECGHEIAPIVRSILGLDRLQEFVWVLRSGEIACFGFDDPEKPHILEWSCVDDETFDFQQKCNKAFVEIDAMGSSSSFKVGERECKCQIKAEHSTKVVEFSEDKKPSQTSDAGEKTIGVLSELNENDIIKADEEEDPAFSLRMNIPIITVSVIDNAIPDRHGREILLAQFDGIFGSFSQSREGYHEIEFRLVSLQVDNHVPSSIHPVLIFCPKQNDNEPFIHLSGVRRLQELSTTYVFRYAAFRMLEVNISLDRMTAETVARFIEPLLANRAESPAEAPDFVAELTRSMTQKCSASDRSAPADISQSIYSSNSGRIYFEQLHLHPIRISLTFTQEWMELNQGNENVMVFQFIRGMASIAEAPLTFTSFVVSHVFESPQTLLRVIGTHYSSQLTKQIFAILGSLAILGAPADFISNVGTGVRDFFYEPIQGAVHGPRQFIEGLEAGTQSLARGVFVGVVRGAANVAEMVNHNLALASADDDFIDERKAHQRMLTDAMSRGVTSRKFSDSMYLAAASVARGVRSGALGIVEQPARYASKHGPIGLVKGIGKAVVGIIVKPVVGVGDAAALLMNHVSDITSNKQVVPKIPKRLRRALPSRSIQKPNCVILKPFDDRAAKAQKIVTGGESCDDVYVGHVNIPSHLIIASEQCLWAIDRRSRDAWCVSWEEISHFGRVDGGVRVVVFSQTGLKPYVFQVEEQQEVTDFQKLLIMQREKMGNATSNLAELKSDGAGGNDDFELSLTSIPGIKSSQEKYVFGSCNRDRKRLASSIKDEIDLIEQCFGRVKRMGSEQPKFFVTLDEEAWTLVSCWGQVFSGLSSRRCIAASIINGTGGDIQIKSTKLLEGGSPCYSIPTKEFDADHGVLHAGGVIIFFGWSQQPSLLQQGNVFMQIETNAFTADLAHVKCRDIYAEAFAGYELGFLEKSFDDHGWWAKYWLLIRKTESDY